MKNPNRLLATSLTIAAIGGATAGETSAATGGVSSNDNPNAITGGVSAAMTSDPTPLAQRLNIEKHIESGKPFKAKVLEAKGERAQVYVTDSRTGELMINPLVLEYGGKIISYVARKRESGVATTPADRADVIKWIGHHEFPVHGPANLVKNDTLRAVPDTNVGAIGFEDASDKAFGLIP